MKLRLLAALALVGAVSLPSRAARADDPAPPPRHRSPSAYAGGIALISIGSLFVTVGTVYGVAVLAAGASAQPSGDGPGPITVVAVGGAIAAGATLVGLAMLVPGIVLVVKNHPGKIEPALPSPVAPPPRDAHAEVPAPRFMSVPLLSGTF